MNQVFKNKGVNFVLTKMFQFLLTVLKQKRSTPAKIVTKSREIKYISEGIELPFPFYKEYTIILNAMESSWKERYEYHVSFNSNFQEKLVLDRKIKVPKIEEFSYSYKHVLLAETYLLDQNKYLKYLN